MNNIDVVKFIIQYGGGFKNKDLSDASFYFQKMLGAGRVIGLYENGSLIAIMLYTLTNNPEVNKLLDTFDYVEQELESDTVLIDKVVAVKWNKSIRNHFESVLIELYPNIEYAVGYKTDGNRQFKSRRRLCTR